MQSLENLSLLTCLVILMQSFNFVDDTKVGILGAGIGGSSAAYFLSQEIPNVEITIFERDQIGGRLAVSEVDGREYEVGGSIIHNSNKFMLNFLDICSLKKKKPIPHETFSLFNDEGVLFQETGYELLDKSRLVWKYGIYQLFKLEKFYQDVLSKFLNIYQFLEQGESYKNVEEILTRMNPELAQLTTVSLRLHLVDNIGLDEKLVDELVSVATKFNYGQLPEDVHAFVGAVALIGFDKQLWAVEGGNYQVCQCALNLSKSRLVFKEVQSIKKVEDSVLVDDEKFDIVIIASPLPQNNSILKYSGGLDLLRLENYHRTVSTIIQGDLKLSALGLGDGDLSTSHYFLLSTKSPVWSVERMTPTNFHPVQDDNMSSVYRLFSHHPVNEDFLGNLFDNIAHVSSKDWLAYPEYSKVPHNVAGFNFEVADNIYYINNIESAASAMEMSVLSARNIVNLIRSSKRIGVKDEL